MIRFSLAKTAPDNAAGLTILLLSEGDADASALECFFDTPASAHTRALLTEPGQYRYISSNHGLVMLYRVQKQSDFDVFALKKVLAELQTITDKQALEHLRLYVPKLADQTHECTLSQVLGFFYLANRTPYAYTSKAPKNKTFKHLSLMGSYSEDAMSEALALAQGMELCIRLADMPANDCTPSRLAQAAEQLAKEFKSIRTRVFDTKDMQKLGMGALLAVAQGSDEPPRFIECHYKPKDAVGQPIVLVGKGITFDSGGLSIKPANTMDEMKYDMCGGASVLGTIRTIAALGLSQEVIGLVPSAENMVSGKSVKPGDVVKSLSGQTIEILNTDAEGRLLLADALSYAKRFSPKVIIDIATLTGAMIVALGTLRTGFMANDDQLAHDLEACSKRTQDLIWRLPYDKPYQEALESPIADMINGAFDRTAGAITAACFLSRFVDNTPWAHLDVAGTAWISGKKRQATGRPIPLLVEYIKHASATR